MVLLETHCQSHQTLKEDFNFNGLIEVAAIGQAGGIAILWLSNVLNMELVATTAQEIHCHIQVHPFPFKFLFSVIYASTNMAIRQYLWENIMCLYDNYKGPWIIGGDFNEITQEADKFGGLPISNA